ncbi:MAG: hypothetical protein JWM31_1825, partial [Solirubrobacterales bacterium]|nr:hypothetical protein [Solirubrobacterales bacterium]
MSPARAVRLLRAGPAGVALAVA